ncbi:MAG: hypothetical protein QGD94_03740 [Planctomycetia bacterium]|nr:hypothetical protein [Planctomycetia bacterium]
MAMNEGKKFPPALTLAVAWAVPGAGHLCIGQRNKAVVFCVLITGTLLAGWILGGCTNVAPGSLWYFAQLAAGVPTLILTPISQFVSANSPSTPLGPTRDIATLYTAIAGLLNILVLMDAYVKSAKKGGEPAE